MAEYQPTSMMVNGHEVVWWRPVCDRDDTCPREPHGEIPEMLAIKDRGDGQKPRCLTFAEAIARHKYNCNFTGDELPEHEGAHIIKGMIEHIAQGCPEDGPHPLTYQGVYDAEIFVVPIQSALKHVASGEKAAFEEALKPESFIKKTRAQFERFEDVENLTRTLCHLIGRKTGKSPWEIRRECQFSDDKLIHEARRLGYTVAVGSGVSRSIALWQEYEDDFRAAVSSRKLGLKKDYARERVWLIDGPDLPCYYNSAFGNELPRRLPPEVRAFTCPGDEEIIAHHALAKPVLEYAWKIARGQKQAFRLRDALKKSTAKTPAFFHRLTARDILKAAQTALPQPCVQAIAANKHRV